MRRKSQVWRGIIWGVVLSIKKSPNAFRCSFLGSLKTLDSKQEQRPKQLSKLLDTLRPALHTCQARNKNKNKKKKKNSFVCCRDTRGGDKLRTNVDLVLGDYDDDIDMYQYQYEDGEDYEYYEEENDLNFDKVIIYSHRNAAGGR